MKDDNVKPRFLLFPESVPMLELCRLYGLDPDGKDILQFDPRSPNRYFGELDRPLVILRPADDYEVALCDAMVDAWIRFFRQVAPIAELFFHADPDALGHGPNFIILHDESGHSVPKFIRLL